MAYGKIPTPRLNLNEPLSVLTYSLPSQRSLFVFPLTLEDTPESLRKVLSNIFTKEVEKGLTYPHLHPPTYDDFIAYFFSGGYVFIGLVAGSDDAPEPGEDGAEIKGKGWEGLTIEEVRAGRDWEVCLGGYYYVKPNYPGRSSHICNGGFIVNPDRRGLKIGSALGKSYLINAPKLGYRASIFNLVYTNNQASVKIWDNLGFTRAGLVPEAGHLKKMDGTGEEYVDAIVFYKKFD